jgi:uncharacterized protein Usg
MASPEFVAQLQGWRLATAHILYHMPDHPALLQSFTWQTYDLAPKFPRIVQFVDFWKREIEADLHSVRIAAQDSINPGRWQAVDAQFLMN